jgi:Holliday junction resolvase
VPNRSYKKGYAFENKLVNDYKARGFHAWRSAGSHEIVDVTACKDGRCFFIQAKADDVLSPGERASLIQAARAGGAIAVMELRAGRKRSTLRAYPPDYASFE